MHIEIKKFEFKDEELRKKAFLIRKKVFVIEQECPPEIEYEFEEESIHFLLFEDNVAKATARYRETKEGLKLERFAVLKEDRGKGYGYKILIAILDDIKYYKKKKYMHAQIQVIPFYEKVGFKKIGKIFKEANIMHYKMLYDK